MYVYTIALCLLVILSYMMYEVVAVKAVYLLVPQFSWSIYVHDLMKYDDM